MSEKVLLSDEFTSEVGLKGRNFYMDGYGFGSIVECDVPDPSREGNIHIHFRDVDPESSVTGAGFESDQTVISDQSQAIRYIDLTSRFIRNARENI